MSTYIMAPYKKLPVPSCNDVRVILITYPCVLHRKNSEISCSIGDILITKGNDLSIPESIHDSLTCILLKEVFFDTMFLSQIMDCPIFYDFLRTETVSERFMHFDCFSSDITWTLAHVLFFEAAKQPESEKTVHAACTLLFTNLHQVHRERLLIGNSTMMEENRIGEILTYMSNNYKEVTLESIAQKFHYHPSYFSAMFKKDANITFRQQLLKIRLEQAKYLLRETVLPVQSIIEEIGFSEKSHFHRCFKKEYGLTPLQYRQKTKSRNPLN